ncbi:uncharacterized protein C8Q71DRAFT_773748 [Rhodofomes roseus]|uniref:Uncharacterized protein n=1 Tax=Rhodofomes roseus TaxID=34475 RepID=A0ABQ8K898_9APHY|nr:uncharacterized protein C8Q71DRAFT_773748 [Rhodofomes roseus]KAH9833496.1 hypothetical protein C8Q71DRAFT_773748 [Rhodofomes roseus]
MSPSTSHPSLQSESVESLKQRLAIVERETAEDVKANPPYFFTSQQLELGVERDQLRSALAQAQKAQKASKSATQEPVQSNVDDRSKSRKANSSKRELTKKSDVLSAKEDRRKVEKLAKVETELQRRNEEIRQLDRSSKTEREALHQKISDITEAARLEAEDNEERLNGLRKELQAAQEASAKAIAERDAAIAAQLATFQQANDVLLKLTSVQEEVLTLSRARNHVDSSFDRPADKGRYGEELQLRSFMNKLLSLPSPGEMIHPCRVPNDASSYPAFARVYDVYKAQSFGVMPSFEGWLKVSGNGLIRLKYSHRILLIQPAYTYDSRGQEKFTACPFLSVNDQAKEVLFQDGDHLYYIGTYKPLMPCENVQLGHLQSGSYIVRVPLRIIRMTMNHLDMCFFGREHGRESWLETGTVTYAAARNAVAIILPELYRKGFLRLNVIGLQCVGFNRHLYEAIHQNGSVSDEPLPGDVPDPSIRDSSQKRRSDCTTMVPMSGKWRSQNNQSANRREFLSRC